MMEIAEADIFCAILLGMIVLIAAMTMMNMLIGVLCEVITTVAAVEREEIAVNFLRRELEQVLKENDNGDCMVSMLEFETIMRDMRAINALKKIGVDTEFMIEYADFFFLTDDEGVKPELTFEDFLELVLKLRGDNYSKVSDIVDLKRFMLYSSARTSMQLTRVEDRVRSMAQDVRKTLPTSGTT